MTMDEACRIVGYNAPRYATRKMTKALKIHRFGNTEEEETRLQAGLFVLRRWKKYQQACSDYRDNKFRRA
jgi:hypothetical protein